MTIISVDVLTGVVTTRPPTAAELAALPPPPALTAEDFRLAIDAHVEATAQAWGYNGAAHIAGYAASTVPLWRAEAAAFIAWRDAVWVQVITRLAAVQAGQQPPPASIPALIATLPAAVRPTA